MKMNFGVAAWVDGRLRLVECISIPYPRDMWLVFLNRHIELGPVRRG